MTPHLNKFRRTHVYSAEVDGTALGAVRAWVDDVALHGVKLDVTQLTFFGAEVHRFHVSVSFPAGTFVHANRFEFWLREQGWHA